MGQKSNFFDWDLGGEDDRSFIHLIRDLERRSFFLSNGTQFDIQGTTFVKCLNQLKVKQPYYLN